MVRLKGNFHINNKNGETSFNSKMVRLKVLCGETCHNTFHGFQFQNGTIKRNGYSKDARYFMVFQFQNGTIKRLSAGLSNNIIIAFQFQNGTIKRVFFLPHDKPGK